MKINVLNKDKIPFNYLSPSSVVEFLINEKSFFKKYIQYKREDKTKPALIIGTAFHFAMEQYYNSIIAHGEDPEKNKILTVEEVIVHGQNKMIKEFTWHERRGLELLLQEKGKEIEKSIDPEKFFEHYYNLIDFNWGALEKLEYEKKEGEEIGTDMSSHKKAIASLKDRLVRAEGYMQSIGLELDRDCGYYNQEIEDAKLYYIEYPEKQNKETAEKQLIVGIINYMKDKPDGIKPIVTEISEVSEFQDFDGNDMPIALKGKPDLLALMEDDDTIIDYKLVSQFGTRNGAYEIQASSYYFIAQKILQKKPKRMLFIESLKREVVIGSGLLKPQLQYMCQENGIDIQIAYQDSKGNEKKKDCTVDELKNRLVEKGILEIPKAVNIIEIDFEESPELIQTFIEIYKEILNRSYYFFIEKTLRFLPNPKADFTGAETWNDFKFEVINEIDVVAQLQEDNSEPKVKIQF